MAGPYLYLSGTPFRALATGEFIEEQIFNWTYTDEQRAKEAFAAEHPEEWSLYGALPQMRLLTCGSGRTARSGTGFRCPDTEIRCQFVWAAGVR